VFCLLVVLIRLSVPVQVIDWKCSFKMTYNMLMGTSKPYSPTHSLCEFAIDKPTYISR